MQTNRITRTVTIRNPQGMHARPAEAFVRLASQFESEVQLIREERRANATYMFELLTLGAAQGTQILIEAVGPDAQAAVEALADLVENGFLELDRQLDDTTEK